MRRSLRTRLLAAGVCSALLAAVPVTASQAAVTTAVFSVTADVQTTCNVAANNNMNFGAYTGAQIDSTAAIAVGCTLTTPYTVGLTQGSGAPAAGRRMTGTGADVLSYSLFQDAGRTIPWGNTIGTDTVAGTGNGASQPYTVYGRIAAGQFVGPGSYSDTITVTLTF